MWFLLVWGARDKEQKTWFQVEGVVRMKTMRQKWHKTELERRPKWLQLRTQGEEKGREEGHPEPGE